MIYGLRYLKRYDDIGIILGKMADSRFMAHADASHAHWNNLRSEYSPARRAEAGRNRKGARAVFSNWNYGLLVSVSRLPRTFPSCSECSVEKHGYKVGDIRCP
jgi:hypothetical protein